MIFVKFQERPFGFRAEQELAELRKQLELLNSIVIQNSCASKSDENMDELNHLVEELTEEKDELCHLLKEKEEELNDVKQRLTQLQSEYIRDVRQEGNPSLHSLKIIYKINALL